MGFCIAIIVGEQLRVLLVKIYLRIALRSNQIRKRIRTLKSLDLLVLNLGIHVLDVCDTQIRQTHRFEVN